jgi:hypothetical protein
MDLQLVGHLDLMNIHHDDGANSLWNGSRIMAPSRPEVILDLLGIEARVKLSQNMMHNPHKLFVRMSNIFRTH